MSNITGKKSIFAQPANFGRTEAGPFSSQPYESTDPDAINRLAAVFDSSGVNYRVDHSFGKSRLEVDYSYNFLTPPASEVPVEVWEYTGMVSQKNLLGANTPSGISNLPPNVLTGIGNVVAGNAPRNDITEKPTVTPNDPGYWIVWFPDTIAGSNILATKAANLYSLMSSGTTDIDVFVPMLRHTRTVSAIFPITLLLENVGLILSTERLVQDEPTMSGTIKNNLPNNTQPSSGTKLYGWYKNFPTVQQIAMKKFQIAQDYQYGLWETLIYGPQIQPV